MTASPRTVTKEDNIRPPLVTRDQLAVDFLHVANAVGDLEAACAEIPKVLEDEEDLAAVTKMASQLLKYGKRLEEMRDAEGRPHIEAQRIINAFFKHDFGKRIDDALTSLEARSKPYLKKKADKERAARETAEREARERARFAALAAIEAATIARNTASAGDATAAAAATAQANALADAAAKASEAAAAPVSQLTKTTAAEGSARLQERWTFTDLDVNTVDLNALRPFIKQAAIEQALRDFIKSGRREIAGCRIINDAETKFRR